jgi:amino acid transporter
MSLENPDKKGCPPEGKTSQPLNPELVGVEFKKGARPAEAIVRVRRPRAFKRIAPGYFVARPEEIKPETELGRITQRVKRFFIGAPLATSDEGHQRLTKFKALAIFGSDPISSSAYASEAAMAILLVAGSAALGISFYLAVAVSALLMMVAFSYRQTVHAYPHGGGTYTVSSENLGRMPGLIGAAALLVDYILTVAVSIVAGSRAITSALIVAGHENLVNSFPPVFNLVVILSLIFIAIMTLGNLRGIRESGTIFAAPAYFFVASMVIMLGTGIYLALKGNLHAAELPPPVVSTQPLTLWLILRAFSAGAVAMSGTEAISNGVPAFKSPESKNAATTLTIMAFLLGAFYLGISFLATHMGLVPGEETIISQIALAVFGHNIIYYIFQLATIAILVVAGNTAFADFPRLSSILARDDYMPHQFQFRGDRLAFNTGIVFLGTIAAVLVVIFRGNVDSLINLYAIGVFLAFTLTNSGMVVHWRRLRSPGWKRSLIINAIGATATSIILIVAVLTKFASGGWIIVVLIPLIVMGLLRIHRHYQNIARQLRVVPEMPPEPMTNQLVVVLIESVNYASLRAFSFARTINAERVVLHVATSPERTEKLREKMAQYAPDFKLVIIESPTRSFVEPLMAYIDAVHSQSPAAFITMVMPEFITAHFWERFLHNRTANHLHREFEKHPNVTVVMVPYLLQR